MRLTEHAARLAREGLVPDEVKRALDPMRSFHAQLVEEVESYERLKRGDLGEISNLHGIGRLLVGARIALYRAALFVSGGLSITLAAAVSWPLVNALLALLYLVALVITWHAPEPERTAPPPASLRSAVWHPFLGFLARHRALEILAFVACYKFADQLAQSLTRPFLIDLGYSAFDRGFALATVGLAALVFALLEAPAAGWGSPRALVPLAVAVVLLAAFVLQERRVAYPLVPLRFFANRTRSAANGTMMLFTTGLFAMFFLLTLHVQERLGWSPLQTGLAYVPMAVCLLIGISLSQRLVGRLDPKLHRDRGELEIRGLWWEPGVKATRARRSDLDASMESLAGFVGAERIVRG